MSWVSSTIQTLMTTMAKFIKHTSCDHCGSSDALALYDDGGQHCFSCGYTIRPNVSPYVTAAMQRDEDDESIIVPNDIGFEYDRAVLDWVSRYDMDATDLIAHKVYWSKSKQQLIFMYPKIKGNGIGCLQARNFKFNAKTKYHNQGNAKNVLPIYSSVAKENVLVITEDAISAIKVSHFYDSMPLLGSYLPLPKITAIKELLYNEIILWLDHDKYSNALTIAKQFQWIGIKAKVVCTPLDPKEYTIPFIKDKLMW